MNRKVLAVSLVVGLGNQYAVAADEIGNGGDHIRIVFQQARFDALEMIKFYEPAEKGDRVDIWIASNKQAIIDEGLASSFRWAEELPDFCPKARCACTLKHKAADLHFSLKDCQQRFIDRKDAGKLIVHELVHHFGIEDEGFADAVAIRVYDADMAADAKLASLSSDVVTVEEADAKPEMDVLIGAGYGQFHGNRQGITAGLLEGAVQSATFEGALQYLLWKDKDPRADGFGDGYLYQVQTQAVTIMGRKNLNWFQFGFGLGRAFAEAEYYCSSDCTGSDRGYQRHKVYSNYGVIEGALKYDVTRYFRIGLYGNQYLYGDNEVEVQDTVYFFPETLVSLRLTAGF